MDRKLYTPEDIGWPPPDCPGHRGPSEYRGPLPIPFAVLEPSAPSPARLAELAALLDATPQLVQVIGIDQMRRGQRPWTPCSLLGVPWNLEKPFDPVALVFVKWQDYHEPFGRELVQKLAGLAVVSSPEFYSAINK